MATITDQDIAHVHDDGYVASGFLLFGADTIAAGRQADPQDGLITGLRYQNITIPKNSIIISASLKFRARLDRSTTVVNTRLSAEAADDPPGFSGLTKAQFLARFANRTTATVSWNAIGAWTAGNNYSTPDIKTIVQELVNRAGWTAGNAMMFFWDDEAKASSESANRAGWAWDSGVGNPPFTRLNVEYTEGPLTGININMF